MNCGQARNLFSAYWDDEITQGEREWLESHFSSCPSCRREYDALARTLEALSDLPRVEVSNGFADRVLAAAKRRSPAVDRMPVPVRRWVPITATAVLLAVVAAMVMQWSGMPLGPRHQGSVALEQPVLTQPQPVQTEPATPAMATVTSPDWVARAAGVTDSLFDHSEDVEFILDPVTLRKGRAHTVVRVQPEPARGEQAVITF
jgi:predicted anti-sigma-YlaC factor YlaD